MIGRPRTDPQVQAIVVTGAVAAFIAGADIKEFGKIPPGSVCELALSCRNCRHASRFPQAGGNGDQGVAFGGGLRARAQLSLPSAPSRARKSGQPEVKLGLIPGAGGTQRLPRLAGVSGGAGDVHHRRCAMPRPGLELGIIDSMHRWRPACTVRLHLRRQVVAERRPLRWPASVTTRIARRTRVRDLRGKIEAKARGQLAPWRTIDAIEAACTRPNDEASISSRVFRRMPRQPPASSARPRRSSPSARRGKIPGTRRRSPAAADSHGCRGRRRHHGRRHRHELRQRRHSRGTAGAVRAGGAGARPGAIRKNYEDSVPRGGASRSSAWTSAGADQRRPARLATGFEARHRHRSCIRELALEKQQVFARTRRGYARSTPSWPPTPRPSTSTPSPRRRGGRSRWSARTFSVRRTS